MLVVAVTGAEVAKLDRIVSDCELDIDCRYCDETLSLFEFPLDGGDVLERVKVDDFDGTADSDKNDTVDDSDTELTPDQDTDRWTVADACAVTKLVDGEKSLLETFSNPVELDRPVPETWVVVDVAVSREYLLLSLTALKLEDRPVAES